MNARAGLGLPFAIELDGRFVGQLNVSGITYGSLGSATIGYWVTEDAAGHDATPTAVALATDHCFSALGLHRMEICIRPENGPSLRVVEKLGFRYEGLRRRYIHINGIWRDHFCFALVAEEVPGGVLRRWASGHGAGRAGQRAARGAGRGRAALPALSPARGTAAIRPPSACGSRDIRADTPVHAPDAPSASPTLVTMDIGSWGGGARAGARRRALARLPRADLAASARSTSRPSATPCGCSRPSASSRRPPSCPRRSASRRTPGPSPTPSASSRDEEGKREALRRAHEAARQRAVTRELAAAAPVLRAADHDPALAARRLRRSRLVATLVLVLSVVALVAGIAPRSGSPRRRPRLRGRGGAPCSPSSPRCPVPGPAVRSPPLAARRPARSKDFSSSLDDPEAEVQAESTGVDPGPRAPPLYLRRGRQRPVARPGVAAARVGSRRQRRPRTTCDVSRSAPSRR